MSAVGCADGFDDGEPQARNFLLMLYKQQAHTDDKEATKLSLKEPE
jgi:hypothetical protein